MDEQVKQVVEVARKIDAATGSKFSVTADASLIAASNLMLAEAIAKSVQSKAPQGDES